MKRLILMILFVFMLVGCQRNNQEVLSIEDLRYDNGQITWRALDNVRYYSVVISGVSYNTNDAVFDLSDFASGQYTVSVQAYMMNGDLVISQAVAFTLERAFEIPRNLRIEDRVLTWDALDALYYTVWLNDAPYEVTDSVFELPVLEEDTLYLITVTATYEHGVSDHSNKRYYHTFNDAYLSQTVTYNRLTETPLYVLLETSDRIEVILSENIAIDYQALDTQLIMIPHGYLRALNQVSQRFEMITQVGLVELNVTFVAEEKPYLASNPNVNYIPNQDIELIFELFDGTFEGLSGQGITSKDYTMDGQLLTIHSAFIESILSEQPDRSTIIIGYQLRQRDSISIGYIFIYIRD